MSRYDASSAQCLVFTYKEGLLSPLAHDLKIRVTDFVVEVDEETRAIDATFDPSSLRVECARQDGRDAPGALGDRYKREIEQNIRKDVLHVQRHPEIRFVASDVADREGGFVVAGTLKLHGTERPLRFDARREGEHHVAEVRLHQPDFGIKPYRAALGTLKIKPDVDVRIALPVR